MGRFNLPPDLRSIVGLRDSQKSNPKSTFFTNRSRNLKKATQKVHILQIEAQISKNQPKKFIFSNRITNLKKATQKVHILQIEVQIFKKQPKKCIFYK